MAFKIVEFVKQKPHEFIRKKSFEQQNCSHQSVVIRFVLFFCCKDQSVE